MAVFGANEIVPGLWLGDANDAKNGPELRRRGITHVLTVMSDCETPAVGPTGTWWCATIDDHPQANITKLLPSATQFVHESLLAGKRILVHCAAGISRSATVVAATLIRFGKYNVADALQRIRRARPFINPNPGFMTQLHQFASVYSPHARSTIQVRQF